MKRTWYEIMFWTIEKMFILFLPTIANASCHAKCVSLSNKKCMIQPNLINFHPNEYSQEFHHYPFAVKWDWCVGSCNTLKDLLKKLCAPNKTEDLNLSLFNMIAGINESKILTRHVSYECKCGFYGRKCNPDQWQDNDKYWCEC